MKGASACLTIVCTLGTLGCDVNPTALDLLGTWGGDHLRMDVTPGGAVLEYDCATGSIPSPLVPDGGGRFTASGFYSPGHGGPVLEGEMTPTYAARYVGDVRDGRMILTVALTDTVAAIGTFTLERGRLGSVFKCL